MQQRKPGAMVVLLVGVVLAVVQTANLILWCDADGFATAGPYWLRLVIGAAALLLPYAAARITATAQPAALQDRCPPLGAGLLVTGALLTVAGLAALGTMGVMTGVVAWANLLLPLGAGVWLLYYGVRAFTGYGIRRGTPGHALPGLVLPLYFAWQLIVCFEMKPAAMSRLTTDLQVLYSAAALLFAAVLLKVFLTPGQPCGNTLFAAGSGCFLLCTAAGGPQTVLAMSRGSLSFGEVCAALAYAAFGICGLICAFAAAGPDADAEK